LEIKQLCIFLVQDFPKKMLYEFDRLRKILLFDLLYCHDDIITPFSFLNVRLSRLHFFLSILDLD